ncbi:MAG: peptidyl-prolyl cis-trans isomerase [Candidatus Omnitrophica bacterium]|nr:peptidyl-prolyl cis-trans isomerase [Candidatus Omnitrophota bacterium]
MRIKLFFIPISVIAIFLAGCGTKPSAQDKILVTVANKFITLKDFKHKLSRLPSYFQGMAQNNKKTLLDDMIIENLFLEDALRKGVDRDKEIRDILNEARKKIIIAKFVKTEVDDKVSISGDDMKKFYEEHKEDFKRPEMWRASHILVASEPEAKEILSELANGKSFEELAKNKSIDATAARLGDVGYFRKAQVLPEFENTCFNLKVGQTSAIVHTQFGYHIIKLTDKKDEAVESFEEARPKIENELKVKKRNELFDKLVADLKNKYHVMVEDDAMKAIEVLSIDKKNNENK